MQKMVDTLYIIAGDRGEYPLADLLSAIAWTSEGSYVIYMVDARPLSQPRLIPRTIPNLQVVDAAPVATMVNGVSFQSLHALAAAITGGLVFRQAIIIRDTSMIIGRGLDTFGLTHLDKTGAALLGVRHSAVSFDSLWSASAQRFYLWQLPHQVWDKPPVPFAGAFLFLSYAGATRLHSAGFCDPAKWSQWFVGLGLYVSWITQLLDGNVLCWGSTEKVLPPLYVDEAGATPPHILSSQFLAYGVATGGRGYSERDLRELYKAHRGELAEPVAAYGPVMAGRLVAAPTPGAP